jgi:hypothetical protein
MKKFLSLTGCLAFSCLAIAQGGPWADVSISSLTLSFMPITKQPSILPNPNGTTQAPKSVESTNPNVQVSFVVKDADANATNVQVTATIECSCTILSKGLAKKVYPTTNKDGTVYWNLAFLVGNMVPGQTASFDFTMTGDKIQNAVKVHAYHSDPRDGMPQNDERRAYLAAKGL